MDEIAYQNTKLARYIDEFVHDKDDRTILRMKLIDGYSYSEIGDAVHLDRTTCWHRVERFFKKHGKSIINL